MKHYLFLFNTQVEADEQFCKNLVNMESKGIGFRGNMKDLTCTVMGKEKWKFDLVSNAYQYKGVLFDKIYNFTGMEEEEMHKVTGLRLKDKVTTVSKSKMKKLLKRNNFADLRNDNVKVSLGE